MKRKTIQNPPLQAEPATRGQNAEELRFREHKANLTNQQLIEISYLCMDLIEIAIECKAKLFFEQCNCYYSCFHLLRGLIKIADPEYLAEHKKLVDFYRDGRELSTDCDRLRWLSVPEAKVIEKRNPPGFTLIDAPGLFRTSN